MQRDFWRIFIPDSRSFKWEDWSELLPVRGYHTRSTHSNKVFLIQTWNRSLLAMNFTWSQYHLVEMYSWLYEIK